MSYDANGVPTQGDWTITLPNNRIVVGVVPGTLTVKARLRHRRRHRPHLDLLDRDARGRGGLTARLKGLASGAPM